MSNCEQFEAIAARIQGHEMLGPEGEISDSDLDIFLRHEETCARPDHRVVAWADLDSDPVYAELGKRAKERLSRILQK